ncbi:hypothetical protein B0H10DRAFT_2187592 [Mycena sp. CBHHK59/15]|nr:hypothetical protein B0H10DRAFT_2187592 [Mycena sp. CBHHK59/15]
MPPAAHIAHAYAHHHVFDATDWRDLFVCIGALFLCISAGYAAGLLLTQISTWRRNKITDAESPAWKPLNHMPDLTNFTFFYPELRSEESFVHHGPRPRKPLPREQHVDMVLFPACSPHFRHIYAPQEYARSHPRCQEYNRPGSAIPMAHSRYSFEDAFDNAEGIEEDVLAGFATSPASTSPQTFLPGSAIPIDHPRFATKDTCKYPYHPSDDYEGPHPAGRHRNKDMLDCPASTLFKVRVREVKLQDHPFPTATRNVSQAEGDQK